MQEPKPRNHLDQPAQTETNFDADSVNIGKLLGELKRKTPPPSKESIETGFKWLEHTKSEEANRIKSLPEDRHARLLHDAINTLNSKSENISHLKNIWSGMGENVQIDYFQGRIVDPFTLVPEINLNTTYQQLMAIIDQKLKTHSAHTARALVISLDDDEVSEVFDGNTKNKIITKAEEFSSGLSEIQSTFKNKEAEWLLFKLWYPSYLREQEKKKQNTKKRASQPPKEPHQQRTESPSRVTQLQQKINSAVTVSMAEEIFNLIAKYENSNWITRMESDQLEAELRTKLAVLYAREITVLSPTTFSLEDTCVMLAQRLSRAESLTFLSEDGYENLMRRLREKFDTLIINPELDRENLKRQVSHLDFEQLISEFSPIVKLSTKIKKFVKNGLILPQNGRVIHNSLSEALRTAIASKLQDETDGRDARQQARKFPALISTLNTAHTQKLLITSDLALLLDPHRASGRIIQNMAIQYNPTTSRNFGDKVQHLENYMFLVSKAGYYPGIEVNNRYKDLISTKATSIAEKMNAQCATIANRPDLDSSLYGQNEIIRLIEDSYEELNQLPEKYQAQAKDKLNLEVTTLIGLVTEKASSQNDLLMLVNLLIKINSTAIRVNSLQNRAIIEFKITNLINRFMDRTYQFAVGIKNVFMGGSSPNPETLDEILRKLPQLNLINSAQITIWQENRVKNK